MANRPRSEVRWFSLSSAYRSRLERKGIGKSDYVAGVSLTSARGHSNQSLEKVHRHQRYVVDKYGPRNMYGDKEITPKMLRQARKKYGDDWVTRRLDELKRNYQLSAKGLSPKAGDQRYKYRANEKLNYYAPFWWYHGVFG